MRIFNGISVQFDGEFTISNKIVFLDFRTYFFHCIGFGLAVHYFLLKCNKSIIEKGKQDISFWEIATDLFEHFSKFDNDHKKMYTPNNNIDIYRVNQ